MEDNAYSCGTAIWGLALTNELQSKSCMLVIPATAFTKQAEEREVRDVSGIGLMPGCVIKERKHVEGEKQKNVLREEMRR